MKTDNSLDAYLSNEEFWPENLMDDRIFFLMMLFGDKEIKVFQAYKLYEYLGGDEIILTNIINKYQKILKKKILIIILFNQFLNKPQKKMMGKQNKKIKI